MPELPEVETISRSLEPLVVGRRINRASLLRERLAPDTTPVIFADQLIGSTVESVGRRGKHILVHLSNGRTLIVHLRMSGRFSVLGAETEDPKFTHARFDFADGGRLVFDDQRHFGLMKIVETPALHQAKELAKLAPEPFSDEFSVDYLRRALSRSKRSLKEFLIDQTKVCGLGNIYAAEALFLAGIDPRIAAENIGPRRAKKLHESIVAVLQVAIRHNSGRPVDPENLEGGYFSADGEGWYVYDRENEPCLRCTLPIRRLKQGGRSTYYCRRCQRK